LSNGWSQGEPLEEALAQADGLLDEMILRRVAHYAHRDRRVSVPRLGALSVQRFPFSKRISERIPQRGFDYLRPAGGR
jgi:hypothetical protein